MGGSPLASKHLVQSTHPVTPIFLRAFLKLNNSELLYFCGKVNAGPHLAAHSRWKARRGIRQESGWENRAEWQTHVRVSNAPGRILRVRVIYVDLYRLAHRALAGTRGVLGSLVRLSTSPYGIEF